MAVALVAIATALRLPFVPYLQGRAPYALYFPAVLTVAWLYGVGPTVLASALSGLAAWYFFLPSFAISNSGDRASLVLFFFTTAAIVALARRAAIIREKLAQLADIVSSSDDAIVRKAVDGTIQTWNGGAEKIFGYRPEEVIGKPISLLVPPELRTDEESILARIRRGERVDHYETIRLTKDGRRIDVSLTISPVRDSFGVVVGASKIARDISQRKADARALAEQQEWFRVTLASIGDAVITSDTKGAVTFVNDIATRLTGYTADEALGKPLSKVFNIINEKTRVAVANPADKVLRSGKIVGLANHTALIARDGTEYPIEDSAAPIINDDNRTIGVVLVFQDVTERRRGENAVAEQREWLETTLESIGDAVIATDIRGKIAFMNSVAEHLTGWRSREAKERDCTEVFRIVNEVTHVTVESPVTRVLREGVVAGLANHTVLIDRDGRERPIDDSAAPIRSPDGRIVGVVLVFHDVTERRRAEQERQAAERERERLLESERAARGDAERANRLKDEFVATLSHELRTPLTAILGWTHMLRKKVPTLDTHTLERGLTVIERNTQLQTQLISDLLDISRMISGKLRLDLQIVDLPEIIDVIIEAARPAATQKGITIEARINRGVSPMIGDPGRLQQVVSNLLGNAVKFTNEGGRVTVGLEPHGAHAVLTVIDTGIGIKPDLLPVLFDRFRQADSSTTRRHGGLGLGLAIVKQLVELHGGKVSAHSGGEGAGATFEVTLPAGVSDVPRQDRHQAFSDRAALPAPPALLIEGVQVLIVEDQADTRDLLERILSEAGCRVVAVGSAMAALSAVTAHRPDILVSDIGLPDEDGYTLIQKVRALPDAASSIPAIAVTAFARSEDRTRALHAGFQSYITKPVEPAELLANVASLARMVRRGPGPAARSDN